MDLRFMQQKLFIVEHAMVGQAMPVAFEQLAAEPAPAVLTRTKTTAVVAVVGRDEVPKTVAIKLEPDATTDCHQTNKCIK